MTPDDIAADRAVIDAATRRAGPWAALGTRLLEDTGGCTCGPGGLNGLHEPYCGAEPVAEGSPDVIAFLAAARPGWPRALDALEAAQEGNARLREALDEAIRHKVELDDLRRQAKAERDEARAEVEAMRRGEVDGVFTSVVHGCCERAEQAEAAIARVRALCDEADRAAAMPDEPVVIYTDEVRAALDGGDDRG